MRRGERSDEETPAGGNCGQARTASCAGFDIEHHNGYWTHLTPSIGQAAFICLNTCVQRCSAKGEGMHGAGGLPSLGRLRGSLSAPMYGSKGSTCTEACGSPQGWCVGGGEKDRSLGEKGGGTRTTHDARRNPPLQTSIVKQRRVNGPEVKPQRGRLAETVRRPPDPQASREEGGREPSWDGHLMEGKQGKRHEVW